MTKVIPDILLYMIGIRHALYSAYNSLNTRAKKMKTKPTLSTIDYFLMYEKLLN